MESEPSLDYINELKSENSSTSINVGTPAAMVSNQAMASSLLNSNSNVINTDQPEFDCGLSPIKQVIIKRADTEKNVLSKQQ